MIRGIGRLTVYSRIILWVQPPVKELPTFPFLGFYSHNVTARHGIKKEAPSCAWRKNTSLLSLSSLGHFFPYLLVPQEKRPLETEFLWLGVKVRKWCTARLGKGKGNHILTASKKGNSCRWGWRYSLARLTVLCPPSAEYFLVEGVNRRMELERTYQDIVSAPDVWNQIMVELGLSLNVLSFKPA